jgi:hypothetical protein
MAQRRTQRDWTELAIKVLQERAQEAGILGSNERLVFEPGSTANGVSPKITAYNDHGRLQHQPYWIPSFNPKETARIVERVVDGQAKLLYSMNLQGKFVRAIDAQD